MFGIWINFVLLAIINLFSQKKGDIFGSLSFFRTLNPKISPKILGIG